MMPHRSISKFMPTSLKPLSFCLYTDSIVVGFSAFGATTCILQNDVPKSTKPTPNTNVHKDVFHIFHNFFFSLEQKPKMIKVYISEMCLHVL